MVWDRSLCSWVAVEGLGGRWTQGEPGSPPLSPQLSQPDCGLPCHRPAQPEVPHEPALCTRPIPSGGGQGISTLGPPSEPGC